MHCPFFMRQSMMALCAQLAQFDEELYKVPAGSAPIAAQHIFFRLYACARR
jgi:seryl-tRNA synthetase